jgi:2-polyprenyl-3-methyl-5-hydroxy-6-metoxy-1,4-benzoquinol methylase
MACILCGGSAQPLFSARDYRRPIDQSEYVLNWCKNCAFGRLKGTFSPTAVRSFYDIDYYTHGENNSVFEEKTFLERLRCHLAWRVDKGEDFGPLELGPALGRTVCDIGCGSGSTLEALKHNGFSIVGIEPDAKARELAQKVCNVFDGTVEQLPTQIQFQKFDIVLMSHVLEHCIDLQIALRNIHSILTPSGTFVIEVPNCAASGFLRFGPNWPWSDIPRHINFFTELSLRKLLQKYDFKISHVRYVGYSRQFASHWINTQNEIWSAIGSGPRPKFGSAAWLLLAQTAFAKSSTKYDSIRIHATHEHI